MEEARHIQSTKNRMLVLFMQYFKKKSIWKFPNSRYYILVVFGQA